MKDETWTVKDEVLNILATIGVAAIMLGCIWLFLGKLADMGVTI